MSSIPDSAIIIGAVSVVLGLVRYMHGQAMSKLDEVVKTNGEIKQSIAVHNVKLEVSAKEYAKLSEHQEAQDKQLDALKMSVTKLQERILN